MMKVVVMFLAVIMRSFELIEVDLSEFGFVETPRASCWLRVMLFCLQFSDCDTFLAHV